MRRDIPSDATESSTSAMSQWARKYQAGGTADKLVEKRAGVWGHATG